MEKTDNKPTQADREWCKVFIRFSGPAEGIALGKAAIDAGEFDDDDRMVNIIRHRLAIEANLSTALIATAEAAAAHLKAKLDVDAEIARLREALKGVLGSDLMSERIGWRGTSSSIDLFRCEFCGSEDLDFTEIEHSKECPVIIARAALSTKPTDQVATRPVAAIEQLRDHQRQLDQDGCFVGVSRQAIDEVLRYLGEQS